MVFNTENVKETGEFKCPCCGTELLKINVEGEKGHIYSNNFYCVKCENGFLIDEMGDTNPKAEQEILLDKYYNEFINSIFTDLLYIKRNYPKEKYKLEALFILLHEWLHKFEKVK